MPKVPSYVKVYRGLYKSYGLEGPEIRCLGESQVGIKKSGDSE